MERRAEEHELEKAWRHMFEVMGYASMSRTLATWGGIRKFEYSGSVVLGTEVWYGQKLYCMRVWGGGCLSLLNHLRQATVEMATSFENPPRGSVGAWLHERVTRTATASYVGAMLVHEGYAERVPGEPSKIRFR